ncbi:leucyl aminopeptidase family protein [bacterium]|nr:leucyl aminopeptidase family protein [bacterium]
MSNSLLGFHSQSLLSNCKWGEFPKDMPFAEVVFYGQKEKVNIKNYANIPLDWQKPGKTIPFIHKYSAEKGPVWIIKMDVPANTQHSGQFQLSSYAAARDTMGGLFREVSAWQNISIKYIGKDSNEFMGIICGIEISQYRFKNYWPQKNTDTKQLMISAPAVKDAKKYLLKAKALGESVNVSRHLVNLPPNVLNPNSYCDFVKELFKNSKCKVEVWNSEKLKKENHHLHVAVGQASETPAHLIKISYRNLKQKKHYCFVGKGITFDSGGLDIKPASGMREMKKDMGGSASVVGLAYWMSQTQQKINADFYLALAENSISDEAFRPGDIYSTRSGKTVEIHNTDAEGRLVLCDTLTLASESKPEWIMDLATLTGAIKVALGETTPGVFCNNDSLAKKILSSAQSMGDNSWRMPLDPSQRNKLKSDVADLVNAHEGFGGAVTAALFLEEFVNKTPWAHFDIYSWVGSASGAFSEKGGNGQLVQCLAHLCEQL